ncbi:hypothetical protein ACHAWO_012999 [Cyclotella atomus]|uniref:Uncharacterized protein n=1 Tax=Cyclotella atomus TaxID=382360 RepID=A0ABD3NH26_9STRA
MCNINSVVVKSNCSLPSSQFERNAPARIRDKGAASSSPNESITRRMTLKKQLTVYKNATADCSQVYDGHEYQTCRRNRGDARAEIDKMFRYCPVKNDQKRKEKGIDSSSSSGSSSKLSSLQVIDLAAGFADFNQDDRSSSTVSTAPSSCVSTSSTFIAHVKVKKNTSTIKQGPSVPKPIDVQTNVNSSSTGIKSKDVSPSTTQTAIRRKKSRPRHRNHEMNLKLVSSMRSPRYSKCRPEDLCSSLQDLGVSGPVVDDRLTKSMTDLEANWGDSVDFNTVHFTTNVEVYVFKS